MEHSNDLYMMLGRMDGKIDSLMANSTSQSKTLDEHGGRITALETEVASVQASSSTGKHWLGTIIAVVSVLLTVFFNLFKVSPHG